MNSPSAQTAQFFNDSLRLNLVQFFPNDSLVYDVFGLFQCIISKAGNLLLFHLTDKSQDVHFSQGQGNNKSRSIFV